MLEEVGFLIEFFLPMCIPFRSLPEARSEFRDVGWFLSDCYIEKLQYLTELFKQKMIMPSVPLAATLTNSAGVEVLKGKTTNPMPRSDMLNLKAVTEALFISILEGKSMR
jgi:hypothetical protein